MRCNIIFRAVVAGNKKTGAVLYFSFLSNVYSPMSERDEELIDRVCCAAANSKADLVYEVYEDLPDSECLRLFKSKHGLLGIPKWYNAGIISK